MLLVYIIYGFMLMVVVYTAAGLRYRSPENKAVIVNQVEKVVWPAIVAGKVKPVVYKSFPFSEAADAHRLMESNNHIGKILLVP
jgi:NADPH:quinone reductase-like Zn-dependent oxidoreductase